MMILIMNFIQGLFFWFRFWFLVSNYPSWDAVIWIKKNWPVLGATADLAINQHLCKGSHEDATEFCLNAIEELRFLAIEPIKERCDKGGNTALKELLNKCVTMFFAASMCVLFHKWLDTKEIHNGSKIYWKTPAKYIDPNYTPEILEKLLVKEWDDNLLPLFGIHLDNLIQVPWLLKMLYVADKTVWEEEEDIHPLSVFKIKEFLRKCIDQCRMQIDDADESRSEISLFPIKNFTSKDQHDVTNKSTKSNYRRCCAYCYILENRYLILKDCKRCLVDNCKNPKAYCSVTCQLEHWFVAHRKEHQENMGTLQLK
uniref:MYND-type domain-containing protein n=1 Tax=Strigamia maritima TaxID=126957 RepID=T1J075_STRMM